MWMLVLIIIRITDMMVCPRCLSGALPRWDFADLFTMCNCKVCKVLLCGIYATRWPATAGPQTQNRPDWRPIPPSLGLYATPTRHVSLLSVIYVTVHHRAFGRQELPPRGVWCGCGWHGGPRIGPGAQAGAMSIGMTRP